MHTRPTQVQTSEYPSTKKGKYTQSPFPNQETYLQLIPDGKGKSSFSNDMGISTTLQGLHKTDSVLCVCMCLCTHMCACVCTHFLFTLLFGFSRQSFFL